MYRQNVRLVHEAQELLAEAVEGICTSPDAETMLANAQRADDLHALLLQRVAICRNDAQRSAEVN